jgi:hypothetical protein
MHVRDRRVAACRSVWIRCNQGCVERCRSAFYADESVGLPQGAARRRFFWEIRIMA